MYRDIILENNNDEGWRGKLHGAKETVKDYLRQGENGNVVKDNRGHRLTPYKFSGKGKGVRNFLQNLKRNADLGDEAEEALETRGRGGLKHAMQRHDPNQTFTRLPNQQPLTQQERDNLDTSLRGLSTVHNNNPNRVNQYRINADGTPMLDANNDQVPIRRDTQSRYSNADNSNGMYWGYEPGTRLSSTDGLQRFGDERDASDWLDSDGQEGRPNFTVNDVNPDKIPNANLVKQNTTDQAHFTEPRRQEELSSDNLNQEQPQQEEPTQQQEPLQQPTVQDRNNGYSNMFYGNDQEEQGYVYDDGSNNEYEINPLLPQKQERKPRVQTPQQDYQIQPGKQYNYTTTTDGDSSIQVGDYIKKTKKGGTVMVTDQHPVSIRKLNTFLNKKAAKMVAEEINKYLDKNVLG